ncbi:Z1 domain-containing protein [Marinilactibacillus psychrotolerans]|uniref:Z1 domain-containing protein n=1 Tax=Marinilactibacillus psychrotolerans TaxID=191770 RepID=UPI003889C129
MREIVIDKLESLVIDALGKEESISENDIKSNVKIFMSVLPRLPQFQSELDEEPITQNEIERVISNLEQRFDIYMEDGTMLEENNHKKWYSKAKEDRGTKYWDRYENYLRRDKKLPERVIASMDNATEEIMDALGDPVSSNSFSRKGLVIGAVQSGKTSNYTALINKAADSGYKVIILLTGTIEKLRQQTQGRLDEGFVGVDSKVYQENRKNNFIGVGKLNRDLKVVSFTDTSKDFNSSIIGSLQSIKDPVVFVIKKNKSVLEKLLNWLKVNDNINQQLGKIELPLLMIDDEADNASINTNNPDKDPTVINNGIRSLLQQFSKYSYVGFTATPFANIFIDPFLKHNGNTQLSDDLFPKDFIYLLEQPSNYVGPYDMYTEDGKYHYMIRHNDDMEKVLPLTHKNGTSPSRLPESLKNAVLLFLIANAVRDLRGQKNRHRSMLIHVSRFISVQNIITSMVDSFVREIRNSIKNYAKSDESEHDFILKRMKQLYEKEYAQKSIDEEDGTIKETWNEIREVLFSSISPIQVRTINSGTASQMLDYDEYEETGGLRLIAVGGLSLARGLTLEGLMISYFYRNTKMYDTLMQMGRWFGYRDEYRELCRLWTSEESEGWYAHIAEATEELRMEVKRMKAQRKTPKDFGLRVRSATDIPLIVTARNKSKSTDQIRLTKSLNGQMIETAILPYKINEIKVNYENIAMWMTQEKQYFVSDPEVLGRKKPTFKNVPKDKVISLLKTLQYPLMNDFNGDSQLIKEIEKSNSSIFESWDVVIASNDKPRKNIEPEIFGGIKINPITRSFDTFGSKEYIRVSGSKRRLGAPEYALSGLDKITHNSIKKYVDDALEGKLTAKGNKISPTENMYFNTGIPRNPLVVIYPVRLSEGKPISPDSTKEEILRKEKIQKIINEIGMINPGIAIGIPDREGIESIKYEYLINRVYQKQNISSNIEEWVVEYDEDDEELLGD